MRFLTGLLATMIAATAAAWSGEVARIDVTAQYAATDFAALLRPKEDFLGFIGKDYRRLHIVLTAIRRDAKDGHVYHVKGWSQVKTNRCDFDGDIVVAKITAWPPSFEASTYEAETVAGLGIVRIGKIEARYEFHENSAQDHAGVFAGRLEVFFDVDRRGKLFYDEIADPEAGWANNAYTGTWTPYGNRAEAKIANWGDQRIPASGDFDTGMHYFSPAEKYRANGWQDYRSPDDFP